MSRRLSLTAAVAIIVALGPPLHAAERNVAHYQTRGPYVLHERVITSEDRALIDSQMKDFLLSCWQQYRLGRLITLKFSIEGLSSRTTYYIEPDQGGTWGVTVNTVTTLPGIKPGSDEHYTEERTTPAQLTILKGVDGQEHVCITSGDHTLLEL